MIEIADDIHEIFLQPGDFQFGEGRTRYSTLLGSCVAITLWHPRRLIGGICHFMLPSRGTRASADGILDGRYADEALALFDRAVARTATRPGDYQVRVFGGGNMLSRANDATMDIAARNVDSAYRLLARHAYHPSLAHCGGKGHRKLIFELWSGAVWLAHRPLT